MGETARWAAATVVIGSVVGAIMVMVGMGPRLWLVGVVVLLVSAAAWLFADLATIALPLSWYQHGSSGSTTARPDRRVQLLAARLRSNARPGNSRRRGAVQFESDGPQPADEIVASLVAVLDDHLRSQHGIERTLDADAARDVLGPELHRFVTDPAAARAMTQRRTLAPTIDLVETFTASTDRT